MSFPILRIEDKEYIEYDTFLKVRDSLINSLTVKDKEQQSWIKYSKTLEQQIKTYKLSLSVIEHYFRKGIIS